MHRKLSSPQDVNRTFPRDPVTPDCARESEPKRLGTWKSGPRHSWKLQGDAKRQLGDPEDSSWIPREPRWSPCGARRKSREGPQSSPEAARQCRFQQPPRSKNVALAAATTRFSKRAKNSSSASFRNLETSYAFAAKASRKPDVQQITLWLQPEPYFRIANAQLPAPTWQ